MLLNSDTSTMILWSQQAASSSQDLLIIYLNQDKLECQGSQEYIAVANMVTCS